MLATFLTHNLLGAKRTTRGVGGWHVFCYLFSQKVCFLIFYLEHREDSKATSLQSYEHKEAKRRQTQHRTGVESCTRSSTFAIVELLNGNPRSRIPTALGFILHKIPG